MNVVKLIVFAASEIIAVVFMIKLINIKQNTDLQTEIQYAALSILFMLFAIMLK